jgi:hypothetical protein
MSIVCCDSYHNTTPRNGKPETYRGAFFKTSNSSSVGKARPKTSFGLGFFFSSPEGSLGTDCGGLQEKRNVNDYKIEWESNKNIEIGNGRGTLELYHQ